MRTARRLVQTIFGVICLSLALGWMQKLIGLPLHLFQAITVVGLVGMAAAGWYGTADLEPWTPDDLRDGALGWAIWGSLAVGVLCALLPMPWAVVVGALAITNVCLMAMLVYGRADQLGVLASHAPPSGDAAPLT